MRYRIISWAAFGITGVLVVVFVFMMVVLSGGGEYLLDVYESYESAEEGVVAYGGSQEEGSLRGGDFSGEVGRDVLFRERRKALEGAGSRWREHGRRYAVGEGARGLIAVVIDDVGERLQEGLRAVRLGEPVTISLLPYARYSEQLAREADENGHDIFVHLPMEPEGAERLKVGKMALMRGMADDDIEARMLWNLTRFDGVVGVNNHMGSRFTRWEHGMEVFLRELKAYNLPFLDSMTHPKSKGWRVAKDLGVSYAVRDVFIDHDPEVHQIRKRIKEVEALASDRGYAVAIAHPYVETLSLLKAWLKSGRERGYIFVPMTTLMVFLEGKELG